jgi:hypothetical protein
MAEFNAYFTLKPDARAPAFFFPSQQSSASRLPISQKLLKKGLQANSCWPHELNCENCVYAVLLVRDFALYRSVHRFDTYGGLRSRGLRVAAVARGLPSWLCLCSFRY